MFQKKLTLQSADLLTFEEYGLRFDLEANFLDKKSGDFQLESSKIRNPCRLAATAVYFPQLNLSEIV